MEIKKIQGSVEERAAFEGALADLEKQKANTDYIAMMADIDLPEEGEAEYE